MTRKLSRIRIVVTVMTLIAIASMTAAFADPIRLFNTGVDDSNHTLAVGATDPHYTIIASPFGPTPAVVVTRPGIWVANDGDSQWIGRVPNADSGDTVGTY